MNKLIIEDTEFTPGIHFDPDNKKFEIFGVSRPENVLGFYQKPLDYLHKYVEVGFSHLVTKYTSDEIEIWFKMVYFNSSSSKSFLQILDVFKEIEDKGMKVKIKWCYDEGDDQMLEDGEDLQEATNLDFDFIPV
ncbi:MAG: DUF1987 domain-containing protein [Bacteroidales bacterium]|nr:DUF1987 domain-containing protein [Bacteroidales bacterium]